MSLAPGARLGPYEIITAIGVGGMGEVYRARDTRLNRDVAIKVLPPGVADNPIRRARFEREAQAISRLSHPNICAVYDVGEQDGVAYLVMEFIEGESLEHRLRRGPLPANVALSLAIQIAEALDAAHRHEIVHRDLKPANVMISGENLKLLDFGLAKLRGVAAGADTAAELTKSLTAESNLVGTLHYMAPEQLEGLEVDARTDLFAFGAVLHEMLTGCRAFEGTSPASVIAAILTAEPTRVSSSVAGSVVSPALDRAVRRALAKDPEERWQTARDLIHELRWIVEDSSRGGAAAPQSKGWSQRYALMTIGAAALIVLGATLGRVTRPPVPARVDEPPTVFEVAAPEGTRLSPGANLLAVSPDSRWVAFIAGPEGGHDRIWLRSLGSPITRPLAGTEDAAGPFWSPDSRSIGFYSRNELERVEIAGGQPTHVAKVARRGLLSLTPSAFWAANDTIVFSELFGLYRVSATGGEPTLVSAPNQARGERSHILPSPLSDGRFLYSVVKRTSEEHEIRVSGLDKPSEVVVPNVGSNAVAASGYLLFRRGESLVAQPFDDDALRLTGQPVTLAEGVGYNPANGRTMFAASPGVLAYRLEVPRTLTWRDRNGRPAGSIGQVGRDRNPAIAPDGSQHVAIDRFDSATNTFGVWTIDEREHSSAVSLAARARFPVWSPDGHWLAFLALGAKGMELRRQPAAAGAGEGETLLQADEEVFPLDWSRDGRFLIYQAGQPGDLWALPLVGSRTPVQVTATPWRESFARLSPDGHWIAYTSDESGQDDVWVQAFPSREEKRKISVNGGIDPTWRADGKELFYLARDGTLVAIPVSAGATLTTGKPLPLFHTTEGAWHFGPLGFHLYSAAPDGQRFLVNEATEAHDRITVVVHWTSLVRH